MEKDTQELSTMLKKIIEAIFQKAMVLPKSLWKFNLTL